MLDSLRSTTWRDTLVRHWPVVPGWVRDRRHSGLGRRVTAGAGG